MKFWQKVFCGTFIICLLIFDIAAASLLYYSYDFSYEREKENAINEQTIIAESIEGRISIYNKTKTFHVAGTEEKINVLKDVVDNNTRPDFAIAIYDKDAFLYGENSDIEDGFLPLNSVNERKILSKEIKDEPHILVVSSISSYPSIEVVCVKNVSQLSVYLDSMVNFFILINILLCLVMGVVLFLFIKKMTNPLQELNSTTKEIVKGDYTERVKLDRNDEFGELGETYNIMIKSIEEKIDELTKARDDRQQFINNLSHEMRTPMTSIKGYSDYIGKAVNSAEDRVIAMRYLKDAVERLEKLSFKLSDMMLLQGKNIELEDIDLMEFIEDIKKDIKAKYFDLDIKFEFSSYEGIIKGDKTLLLSLVLNLVENSVRALKNRENKKIEVNVYKDEYPIIEVVDNGCGMKEEEIKKITEPFYRVDKSRSRENGGAGLGMSIVEKIVQLHNIDMKIESTYDIGTTVKVVFTNNWEHIDEKE